MKPGDLRREAEQQLMADLAGIGEPLVSIVERVPEPMSEKGKRNIISMTFKSDSEDVPHVVTLGPDGVARCTCKAMLSIEYRPTGCWAMRDFRAITGIHEP